MTAAGILLAAGAVAGFVPPADPLLHSRGTWGQALADQWAIQHVGLTTDAASAWALLGPRPAPVIVAVIDTGLDWNHLDLHADSLWRNPREVPGNGRDDDGDGHVDDVIGWDFLEDTNRPWDHDGHGTLVAGVLAAQHGNRHGIAGINPWARLMVLKAVNDFGHTRASYLAAALRYAADHGARIANLSVGGRGLTSIETAAVDYALARGVLIVAAAGNDGRKLDEPYGVTSLDGVLVVGASGPDDRRLPFSNWGPQIDLTAPGLDVLSLRARRTDTMRLLPGLDYVAGSAYVGRDKRYYRATGTSFAAPIVSGVASLVLSRNPALTREELTRILLHSARDVGFPGVDQHSGYGLVDARAALTADPRFFLEARIDGVRVVAAGGGPAVEVRGTADGDRLARARLEIGAGDDPQSWTAPVEPLDGAVRGGVLGTIPGTALSGATRWTLRLIAEHESGRRREARFELDLE